MSADYVGSAGQMKMTRNNTPVIALAGNPNVGKTTLFNALTGSRQTVGNWPGVTVEHKSGSYSHKGVHYEVVDLPGIYSLSGGNPDELVARDFILNAKPDLIINIVDASNLERNLYLTIQLMELGAPILMCLSMTDIAERNGLKIDLEHLSSHLGFEAIPLVLNKKFDSNKLLDKIVDNLDSPAVPQQVSYDHIIEEQLEELWQELLREENIETDSEEKPDTEEVYSKLQKTRWRALKLLEKDEEYLSQLNETELAKLGERIAVIEKHRGQDVQNSIADSRYGYIRGLEKDVVKRGRPDNWTFSDAIDKVLLSGYLGLPIFFFVMYLVFLMAVTLSEPIMDFLEGGLLWLFGDKLAGLLSSIGTPEWLNFLISDAIGGGLATIASFIPPIFFIYISLSILEDSGYMARAAFIADKFMRRIGLPGKAFIPLLVGFGCTVPAIMATRTLESPRDRVFASLLTPFMSCGAKLPVYTFLAMIFFPRHAGLVIFGLYFFGIVMAMLTGLLLKKTIFKTEPGNFVMELPPYHFPTFNGIMLHTWFRLKDFILRAGKTILIVIVVINILGVIKMPNILSKEKERVSVLEIGGHALTPVLKPMGIETENWPASVALITGLFAKEAIVGTLHSLYSGEELSMDFDDDEEPADSVKDNIKVRFGGWASAMAFLLFVVLYSPCMAALTMLFQEHGAKWTIFSFIYLNLLAWLISTVFYQIAAFNSQSFIWLGVALLSFVIIFVNLKLIGNRNEQKSQI